MRKLAKLLAGLDDPFQIVKRIRAFAYSKEMDDYALATASRMVTHLFTDAGRTWRQAARRNSQGRLINEALRKELQGSINGAVRHQIERNATIIKSLPLDVSKLVTEHILAESMKGVRANDIAEQIKELFPEKSNARAELIARTETSKTSTALTRARSENLGVGWYVWRTSEDSRVRDSHALMNGVLVRWSDPPSPEQLDGEKRSYGHYHAGEIFYCRCYGEPVIDRDLIAWPAKVYYGGRIQKMTRKQFETLFFRV
ncbi:phage head morphogenesis protein [Paenibacillus oleatilyticus]|uniref:Phage minor head protein n=1 Tax=Paenibacillus oleatilyticus TaxID=2594886 RepID=A0ABV4UVD1_9BACL